MLDEIRLPCLQFASSRNATTCGRRKFDAFFESLIWFRLFAGGDVVAPDFKELAFQKLESLEQKTFKAVFV